MKLSRSSRFSAIYLSFKILRQRIIISQLTSLFMFIFTGKFPQKTLFQWQFRRVVNILHLLQWICIKIKIHLATETVLERIHISPIFFLLLFNKSPTLCWKFSFPIIQKYIETCQFLIRPRNRLLVLCGYSPVYSIMHYVALTGLVNWLVITTRWSARPT